MSYDHTKYSREWAQRKREENHRKRLLLEEKCPVCEMLLESEYHFKCPFLDDPEKYNPFLAQQKGPNSDSKSL